MRHDAIYMNRLKRLTEKKKERAEESRKMKGNKRMDNVCTGLIVDFQTTSMRKFSDIRACPAATKWNHNSLLERGAATLFSRHARNYAFTFVGGG